MRVLECAIRHTIAKGSVSRRQYVVQYEYEQESPM
jgi:hypothetical protein